MSDEKPILIVEDEFLLAALLEDMLTDNGFHIAGIANTVAKGLKIIEEKQISGAILDYNLQGETSQPIAKALLEQKIPFLFLTGNMRREELYDLFPDIYVMAKPFQENELLNHLNTML